jgi:cephalosporin-C deacetylase-like acetyl esterase
MFNPYQYTPSNNGINCTLKETTSLWKRYAVDISSAFPSYYLGNTRIRGEYLFPEGKEKAPIVILVHGMGDRSVTPCRMIARTLAGKGIASFILYLIFHTFRVPPSIKGRYPNLTAEEWFESYQVSVIDVCQVVDWISTRPELDQTNICVAGISFGSFISSIAMALDKRIKAGVLIESGGNSDKITRHSFLLRWQYKRDDGEYRRNQESYNQYLSEVAEKGFENVIACKSSYLTDPMTFAIYLRQRPLLMINALFDEMIPRAATIDLWESCGRPPLKWYPATHASLWIWYPFIGPRLAGFLESSFKARL